MATKETPPDPVIEKMQALYRGGEKWAPYIALALFAGSMVACYLLSKL